MSDFKAIETQEQLDEIIKERLARAKESTKKDFEGWISPEDFEKKVQELKTDNENLKNSLAESNEKLKGFNTQLSERDAKLKEYEISSVKAKVAAELGLDFKLASRMIDDLQSYGGSGDLFFEINGSVVTYELTSGEELVADPELFVCAEHLAKIDIVPASEKGSLPIAERRDAKLKLVGPGRVYFQTRKTMINKEKEISD